MSLTNDRGAWVNRSGATIPVYEKRVKSSLHTGGLTAGGSQIGTIYPDEFYTLISNDSMHVTNFEIRFRSSAGTVKTGYIETSPCLTLDDYAWVRYQEAYHYYNSNGSSLVSVARETIGGTRMFVFTVKKSVNYYNSASTLQGLLSVGTKIATTMSLGSTMYPTCMWFDKKKIGSGNWVNLTSSGHGYVDLSLNRGSMPNDRAIY